MQPISESSVSLRPPPSLKAYSLVIGRLSQTSVKSITHEITQKYFWKPNNKSRLNLNFIT